MPPGKLSSQSGHAYTDALFAALDVDPSIADRYRQNGHGGSKVTLKAKNLASLLRAEREAKEAGLITALIEDREHILPPFFTGDPVITALGVGPCTKEAARAVLKRLQCV